MKRGEKPGEEVIEKAKELRSDGKSYGAIARELGIAKSTVISYCRDVPAGEAPPGGSAALPGIKLPPASGKRMSESAQVAESRAQEAVATEAIEDLAERSRLRKRREEADLQDQELDQRQRSLELSIKEANLKGPDPQVVQEISGLKLELDSIRQEREQAVRERDRIDQRLQQDQFEHKIETMLHSNQMSQWDFYGKLADKLDQFAPILGSELAGMRQAIERHAPNPPAIGSASVPGVVAATKYAQGLPLSPSEQRDLETYQKSHPGTVKERGEVAAVKIEKAAENNKPDCFYEGVGGYCANPNIGNLPLCGACAYLPPKPSGGTWARGQGETLS